MEGVGEYVTCREGDVRRLPFGDNYFDVVVSGVFVHTIGKEHGPRTAEAAAERMRVVGELVRVLKPGGTGVVWDLLHVPEYVRRLQELKMENIRVSEGVTAFMVSSHIVSFTKPLHHFVGFGEVRLDWRCWPGIISLPRQLLFFFFSFFFKLREREKKKSRNFNYKVINRV